nr:MAG TPA: hypothetical protein [Caudoviricetes sp.]
MSNWKLKEEGMFHAMCVLKQADCIKFLLLLQLRRKAKFMWLMVHIHGIVRYGTTTIKLLM